MLQGILCSHAGQIDDDFAFFDQDLPEINDNQGQGWLLGSIDGFRNITGWGVGGQKIRLDDVPAGICPVLFTKVSRDTRTRGDDTVKLFRPMLTQ